MESLQGTRLKGSISINLDAWLGSICEDSQNLA